MYIDELNKMIADYPDTWRKGQKYINALRYDPILYTLVCGLGEIDCFYSDVLVDEFIEVMSDTKENIRIKLMADLCSDICDNLEGTHSTIKDELRGFNIFPELPCYGEIYEDVEAWVLESEISECECCGMWGFNDEYLDGYGFVCSLCYEPESSLTDDDYDEEY